jgi:hypothetical protein
MRSQFDNRAKQRQRRQASSRAIVLLLVGCILGIGVSAAWFYAATQRKAADSKQSIAPGSLLSEGTRAVLSHLDAPVEVRYYAILDPATVSGSVAAFAGRVGELLAAYEQAGGEKFKLIVVDPRGNASAAAAAADGLAVFYLDKGEACYLGATLSAKGHKETLARLAPEWEPAVEPDLTRAISRLMEASQVIKGPKAIPQINTNAIQEVRTLIPDVTGVSVEQGKQMLQEIALKEFTAAAKAMQEQLKDAEQQLGQAQKGGIEAEVEAARKHLQQVQAEQTAKLQQIAAKSKAQVETFQQMKAAGR